MICDGLTTAAKVLLEVEDYIKEGVGDVPRYAGQIDRCGDRRGYRRVKCEDGCGFGGCVTAGFSLPKGCYATILRSRVCEGVMCRGFTFFEGMLSHGPRFGKTGIGIEAQKIISSSDFGIMEKEANR